MDTDRYSKPSFESPHNIVHNVMGCRNGTMLDLNWASFDPAFMLHHANVDRLIALWQAIYPEASIFDIVDYENAIYGTAAGNVSADSPLKPFYRPGGHFFTSNTVKDISTFGYSYPELQPTDSSGHLTQAELSAYVKSQVNALYSDDSVHSGIPKVKQFRGGSVEANSHDTGARLTTWSVSISLNKSEIRLPATVSVNVSCETAGIMALLAIPNTGVEHSTINLDRTLYALNMTDTNRTIDSVRDYLSQTLQVEMQTVSEINWPPPPSCWVSEHAEGAQARHEFIYPREDVQQALIGLLCEIMVLRWHG